MPTFIARTIAPLPPITCQPSATPATSPSYPQFVDFAGQNFHLKSTSPCINTGTNLNWMNGATDLDGQRRKDVIYGIVDMGCYEYATRGTMFIVR